MIVRNWVRQIGVPSFTGVLLITLALMIKPMMHTIAPTASDQMAVEAASRSKIGYQLDVGEVVGGNLYTESTLSLLQQTRSPRFDRIRADLSRQVKLTWYELLPLPVETPGTPPRLLPFWPGGGFASVTYDPEIAESDPPLREHHPSEKPARLVEEFSAGIGGQHFWQSDVAPIHITVHAGASGFKGSFRVSRRASSWSTKIDLHRFDKGVFELEIPIPPPDINNDNLEATLMRDGDSSPCWVHRLHLSYGTGARYWIRHIQGVGTHSHARLVMFRVPQPGILQSDIKDRADRYIFTVDPLDAPRHPEGWSGAACVVADRESVMKMEPESRAALLKWEALGGPVAWMVPPAHIGGKPLMAAANGPALPNISHFLEWFSRVRGTPDRLLDLGRPLPPALRVPVNELAELLVGIYVLTFGVLSLKLMAACRRIVTAWLIVPGFAIALTVSIVLIFKCRPELDRYNSVTVQRTTSGSGVARVLSQATFFSPGGSRTVVRAPMVVSDLEYWRGIPFRSRELTDGRSITSMLMPEWSQFDVDFRGSVTLSGTMVMRNLGGERYLLENRTLRTIPPSWLLIGRLYAAVPALLPGSRAVTSAQQRLTDGIAIKWKSSTGSIAENIGSSAKSQPVWVIPGGIPDPTFSSTAETASGKVKWKNQTVLLVLPESIAGTVSADGAPRGTLR